jgi:hypothetical protein
MSKYLAGFLIILLLLVLLKMYMMSGLSIVLLNRKRIEEYMSTVELVQRIILDNEEYKNIGMYLDRIGTSYLSMVSYRGWLIDGSWPVVATGIGVLRNIDPIGKLWYICCVKVDPEYENMELPEKMFTNAINSGLAAKSNRAYRIITDGRLFDHAAKMGFKSAGKLRVYTMTGEEIDLIRPVIETFKGGTFFTKLSKDKLFDDNGQPINLYHLNLIKNADNTVYDQDTISYKTDNNGTYMFCYHDQDPVVAQLAQNGCTTDVTADLVQINLNLEPADWDFIQTWEF